MSGHNKWSKIKRKKGATDAKRSKEFSRIVKEIHIAVKEGGSNDPDFNPRLRMAIANAKGVNMPKDNIERAIKKASDSNAKDLLELHYEGYAPGGIAVFVECTTDNQNRTISNVRSIFNKYGGSLATNGSVDFLFERKGIFEIKKGDWDEDELTLELIDAGAEDVDFDEEEDLVYITTAYEDFGNMQKALEEKGIEVVKAELQRLPTTSNALPDEQARKALRLIEALEEDEDVNNVFHNLELSETLLGEME